MKTIFIVVSRGFIIRNVLRSGVLQFIKEAGCRVIVLLQVRKGKQVPEYLEKEFCDEQTLIEAVEGPHEGKWYERLYRFFVLKTSLLVYSDSTWSYSRAGNINNRQRMPFWAYLEKFIFSILTHFHFLKSITRVLERKVFLTDFYVEYFNKYQPDLVFTTSVISAIDIAFMKEAARRGIKTASMTKGWDHTTRVLYRFIPDKIIVQNSIMKECLFKYQRINREMVSVCGFPQFDWYVHKELLIDRTEYISSLGLDPKKRLIFFGSEGAWAPKDDLIAEILAKYINTPGVLVNPASLIIRPHFSDAKGNRFDRFRGLHNIVVDDKIDYSDALPGGWDPGFNEIKHFVNLMYHSDVVINIASTLTLDACCFDKPIIAVDFGVLHNLRNGRDVTNVYYEMDHYQDVLKTGAVDLVKNEKELLHSINDYLIHPERNQAARKILLDKLCYKVDGNSSRRIAKEILSLL